MPIIVNILMFFVGLILIVSSISFLTYDAMKDKVKNNVRADIVGCWKKLNTQTFYGQYGILKDTEGNTKFYPTKDVDEFIDKLNKVLKEKFK